MAVDHTKIPAPVLAPDELPSAPSADGEVAARLRRIAFDNNLDALGFLELVADVPCESTRLGAAIEAILAGDTPEDLNTLRLIAAQIEHRFDIVIHSDRLVSRRARVGRRVGNAVGAALGFLASYLVFGGLLSGHSHLLGGAPGAIAVVAFVSVIAMLAVVEALHVAATQLRLLDLSALSSTHRRLPRVHRRIRSEEGINSFLAGRQLVVVMTVFVLAPLTTMSTLSNWPFTATELPAVVRWSVEFGLPGAFVTLWLGQLAPQFVATRRTIWLMNTPIAEAFVVLCGIVDAMGLARCGHWIANALTARAGTDPRIPLSPALRWGQAANDENGYALLGQVRRLRLSPVVVRLSVRQGLTVRGSELTAASQPVALAAPPAALTTTSYLVRGGAEYGVTQFSNELSSGSDRLRLLRQVALPTVGAFEPGDEVRVSLDAEFDGGLTCDAAFVDSATRFVFWELELDAQPRLFPPLSLTLYAIGSSLDERTPIGEPTTVYPRVTDDGRVIATHLVDFPAPKQLAVLKWDVSW